MSDKEHDKPDEKSLLTKEDKLESVKSADGAIPDGQTPVEEETKVKFIGNGGASAEDVKVEMLANTNTEKKKHTNEFTGLTKEELMKFSEDPFWVKVRWILLITFWVAWFGMLAAAIVIIVLAPRCPPRPKMEWYQKSVAYQVYPKSFKDSDSNGVGDIKGVLDKLKYIKKLEAKTVWLNSILESNKFDSGYDVVDYKMIDKDFGTMEEFKHMRIAMHKEGMKLIMDFVPNHSSMNHTWFIESSKNKDDSNKYKDYYVWADPNGSDGLKPRKPNNWKSIYGGSAWTFVEGRGQFYLHQYFKEQPDLNLRNPEVKEEIKDAIKFWFEQGVDGLNIVGAPYLFESRNISGNNETPTTPKPNASDYDAQTHTLTKYQPETFDILTEWRTIADMVQSDTDKPRALLVEGDYSSATSYLLEYNGKPGAHMVIDLALTKLDQSFDAKKVTALIKNHMDKWPKDIPTGWMLGNADVKRVASRVHPENLNGIQMLLMTVPGAPATYYGEEIAMTDTQITQEQNTDPLGKLKLELSRDVERTPMQWTNGPMAGFTDGHSSWLPINPNYKSVNVKSATAAGAGYSHYEAYIELSKLHAKESFQWGELKFVNVSSSVVAYTRQANGFDGYLVAINFDLKTSPTLDFYHNQESVANNGKVVANTGNFNHEDFAVNKSVDLSNIILNGGEGVIFEWPFSDVKK